MTIPLPIIPESAPFNAEQRAWLNGFLAGLFCNSGTAPAMAPAPAGPARPLLILFGSQTGSAEKLARRVANEAKKLNFAPRVLDANSFASVNWAEEKHLLLVTSTWGDGDPPDNAVNFWAWLQSDAAPRLEHLSYAVLGLGDKNYADFCGASKKFDARLASLGARRLLPRAECDVDYEAAAKGWIEQFWPALGPASAATGGSGAALGPATTTPEKPAETETASAGYNRNRPFPARLKTNRRLNGPGSAKDTRHFEIVLEGSDLSYEAGDALGVMPANCPVLVEELLAALGFQGEEPVAVPGGETAIHEALLRHFNISQPGRELIETVATRTQNTELLALLGKKPEFDAWLHGRDIVDVMRSGGRGKFTPPEFVALLRKLNPRLYSISSSPKAHPGEVHLTVAAVRYEAHGRAKRGVCSTFLADRVTDTTPVPVFVQTSHGFRLPADGTRPVIMIGPGTGIAPFRAFLEERQATGASGKNWLFFGDQQRASDFLYEEQLAGWQQSGHLARLDLAFSRDQKEKIYVQNRMLEQAGEFWDWLESGAHIYVCGDAKRMAKDVDAALHELIVTAGGKTRDEAAAYVAKLKTDKRYQRDVY